MRLASKVRHIPGRLATGSFILNSGLTKLSANDQAAASIHGMATGTYPALKRIDPKLFIRLLAGAEIAIGVALLTPVVPTAVAAAGLAGFSASLLGLYLRTPGMHRRGSLRPTQDGIPLAKDVWLLGMAIDFLIDEVSHRKR
ncbi:MAG TPA: DoxX family membrane protein [Pseudonocardiaceae bacterium]|jgi:uncharacterized membrane protein YphA (DoxX/SURF4 family)|nr:DoxX family membrane protein [Pseudonocardiaceae bacterium]